MKCDFYFITHSKRITKKESVCTKGLQNSIFIIVIFLIEADRITASFLTYVGRHDIDDPDVKN